MGGGQVEISGFWDETALQDIRRRAECHQGYAADVRPDVIKLATAVEVVFEIHAATPLRYATGWNCRTCYTAFPCATRAAVGVALTGRAAELQPRIGATPEASAAGWVSGSSGREVDPR